MAAVGASILSFLGFFLMILFMEQSAGLFRHRCWLSKGSSLSLAARTEPFHWASKVFPVVKLLLVTHR